MDRPAGVPLEPTGQKDCLNTAFSFNYGLLTSIEYLPLHPHLPYYSRTGNGEAVDERTKI